MYTTIDLSNFVYALVNTAEVRAAISGSVYNSFRPTTSVVEDVVVNAVTLSDGTLQIGTANVNIFVPNVQDNLGRERVNMARLAAIQSVVLPLIQEAYFDEGNVWYQSSQMVSTEDNKQQFLNIRLSARLYNNP